MNEWMNKSINQSINQLSFFIIIYRFIKLFVCSIQNTHTGNTEPRIFFSFIVVAIVCPREQQQQQQKKIPKISNEWKKLGSLWWIKKKEEKNSPKWPQTKNRMKEKKKLEPNQSNWIELEWNEIKNNIHTHTPIIITLIYCWRSLILCNNNNNNNNWLDTHTHTRIWIIIWLHFLFIFFSSHYWDFFFLTH